MKIENYVEFGERLQVIQIGRLRGIEKFEGEIENFILNTFINFEPVKRFENRSGVSEFRSFNNGISKRVLDLLETMYLRLWKIVVCAWSSESQRRRGLEKLGSGSCKFPTEEIMGAQKYNYAPTL